MNGRGRPEAVPTIWIEQAERLDREGYFSAYTDRQRDEVLRKGYIGQYSPDEGLALARQHANTGFAFVCRNSMTTCAIISSL